MHGRSSEKSHVEATRVSGPVAFDSVARFKSASQHPHEHITGIGKKWFGRARLQGGLIVSTRESLQEGRSHGRAAWHLNLRPAHRFGRIHFPTSKCALQPRNEEQMARFCQCAVSFEPTISKHKLMLMVGLLQPVCNQAESQQKASQKDSCSEAQQCMCHITHLPSPKP